MFVKLKLQEEIAFQWRFTSVKLIHNSTRFKHFTAFDINFLENVWEFDRGGTERNELKWDVSNSIQNVNMLWVDF